MLIKQFRKFLLFNMYEVNMNIEEKHNELKPVYYGRFTECKSARQ